MPIIFRSQSNKGRLPYQDPLEIFVTYLVLNSISEMKYKKSLAGRPFTKDPPFTKGFVAGVGYMKNLFGTNPTMFIVGVVTIVSAGIMAGRYYHKSLQDPEVLYQHKPRYTVMRRDEVSNPDKPVYN